MRSTAQIAEVVFWSLMKSSVHTIKPAVITSVDYDNACLDATPTTKTKFTDDTQIEENTVYDVPILVISANSGVAKLTMPIKVGDRCFLIYSDRDYAGLLDTNGKSAVDAKEVNPFGRNPIGALCCFFTQASPTTIDDTNVLLQNGSSDLIIAPSGQITIDATNVVVNASGNTEVNTTANTTVTTGGNTTITTTGNTEITTVGITSIASTGAISITSSAAISIAAQGAVAITSSGACSIAAQGGVAFSSSGIANVTSTGIMTLTASELVLNTNVAITGTLTVTGNSTLTGEVTAASSVKAQSLYSYGNVYVAGSVVNWSGS